MKAPRLAAGRARALGVPTRGTTNPNRLRRVDRYLTGVHGDLLRTAAGPVVVDLGYGSSPVTCVELLARLRAVRPDVRVIGVEIDPERVALAGPVADPPWLTFRRGGFELAGARPTVVRAMNVLRQYDEPAVRGAWDAMTARAALVVEGTCDELGRLGSWVTLDAGGPRTLTISVHVTTLARPSIVAERLPKALIHRNVPGQPVHGFLNAFDACWAAAAPLAPYGPRQRWVAAVRSLAADWPVLGDARRWRLGEVTVSYDAVS